MKKTAIAVVAMSIVALFMAATVSAGPVMDRILKAGTLVIGTTGKQPPMTAVSKKGELMGLDADIARAMGDALGVTVNFEMLPFAGLLPALEAGDVDMILSGMSITPKRNRKVVFVGPYLVSGKGILTLSDRYAALQQATGLNAPEVGVAALKDSTSEAYIAALMPKAKRIPIEASAQGIDLLLQNKVDVLVADYPFCALTAYRYQEKGLLAGKAPLTFEPLGIAMPEDTLLVNWVENFLNLLQGSGQLPEMQKKWLTAGNWVDELP